MWFRRMKRYIKWRWRIKFRWLLLILARLSRGAIAALATNQYNIGVETGKMAAKVLRGEKVADLDTIRMTELDLYLNPEAAKLQGVTIPESLLEKATRIIKP